MNTTEHLQLNCGNPEDKDYPASFSRFVFPFAYCLDKLDAQPEELCYQRLKDHDANFPQRKKYLTNETALVSFERAKWFGITKEDWQKTPWKNPITVTLKTGDFQINMLPPVLVLFELSSPQETTEKSTLQTGLLYVDIYFPEQCIFWLYLNTHSDPI